MSCRRIDCPDRRAERRSSSGVLLMKRQIEAELVAHRAVSAGVAPSPSII